jgi:hypothetical protein
MMRSHELARQLLALPDIPVGVRAYGNSNAWAIQPPKVVDWDDTTDSCMLAATDSCMLAGDGSKFVLLSRIEVEK